MSTVAGVVQLWPLTLQGLTERGEALTQLEERTARMMSEAESFANTTHQLMNKYKDKKWYQF